MKSKRKAENSIKARLSFKKIYINNELRNFEKGSKPKKKIFKFFFRYLDFFFPANKKFRSFEKTTKRNNNELTKDRRELAAMNTQHLLPHSRTKLSQWMVPRKSCRNFDQYRELSQLHYPCMNPPFRFFFLLCCLIIFIFIFFFRKIFVF